jgi:hypothetical protein
MVVSWHCVASGIAGGEHQHNSFIAERAENTENKTGKLGDLGVLGVGIPFSWSPGSSTQS